MPHTFNKIPWWSLSAFLALILVDAVVAVTYTATDVCVSTELESGGFDINCASQGLFVLPTDIPLDTESLHLENNDIGALPSQGLSTLTSLKRLDVRSNRISVINAGSLAGLASLDTMVINRNGLTALGAQMFTAIQKSITTLAFANNNIQTVDDLTFQGMIELTYLDLQYNMITQLPAKLFEGLNKLQNLLLQGNSLTTNGLAVGVFSPLTMLKELNLNQNSFEFLSKNIFDGLASLQRLEMGNNPMTELDGDALVPLVAVEVINFEANQFVTVSENAFTQLPNLRALELGGDYYDCCGLEWLRTFPALNDGPAVFCARPELEAGKSLSQTEGQVEVCNKTVADTPDAPQIDAVAINTASITWLPVHGNAFKIDFYEVGILASGDLSETIAKCETGEVPSLQGRALTMKNCKIRPIDPETGLKFPSLSFTVKDLIAYTTYKFLVRAHSELEGGTYSPWSDASTSVLTSPDIPSAPARVTVTIDGPREVTILWTAPDKPNGPLTKFDGALSDVSPTTGTTISFTTPGDGRSIVIKGLEPFTTYTSQVRAWTAQGHSDYTQSGEFITAEAPPEPYPRQPTVVDTSSTSIMVEYGDLDVFESNGKVTSYVCAIYTGLPGTSPIATITVLVDNGRECSFDGLSPATVYRVAIAGRTDAGQGPYGPSLEVTTLDAAPSTPNAPQALSQSSSSCSITWEEPSQTNGNIIQYSLEVAEDKFGSFVPLSEFNLGGVVRAKTVFGLTPATIYRTRVAASTELGKSDWSNWTEFKTLDDIPGTVTSSSVLISSTSLRIVWDPPSISNGIIIAYKVVRTLLSRKIHFYEAVENTTEVSVFEWSQLVDGGTAPTSFVIEDLEPYTQYTYAVAASTQAGFGQLTAGTSQMTAQSAPAGVYAPQITVIGERTLYFKWKKPKVPNGQLSAFQIFRYNARGKPTLYYEGIPSQSIDGRFELNITGVDESTFYQFFLVACTIANCSDPSVTAPVTTGSTSTSNATAIAVAITCVIISILALGFMWERELTELRFDGTPRLQKRQQRVHVSDGLQVQPRTPWIMSSIALRPTGTGGGDPEDSADDSDIEADLSNLPIRRSSDPFIGGGSAEIGSVVASFSAPSTRVTGNMRIRAPPSIGGTVTTEMASSSPPEVGSSDVPKQFGTGLPSPETQSVEADGLDQLPMIRRPSQTRDDEEGLGGEHTQNLA